ncbi:MAG: 50S ribosomal protein L25 [Chloroflexaceae bacterium]|nr:50S ribosomal protein L25 [Chloroflexaceae bacterium]
MPITLECQKRPEGSKPKALRREGLIPANLYGHKGNESDCLVVNAKAVELLLKKTAVNKTPVALSVPDLPWQGRVVIRELQTHPWKTTQVYHLSFFFLGEEESAPETAAAAA